MHVRASLSLTTMTTRSPDKMQSHLCAIISQLVEYVK